MPSSAKSTGGRRPGAPSEPISVMLVDDHPLWRQTVRQLLERGRIAIVVAEASDGAEAVRVAADKRPDVVVMDIDLPTLNGVEATRALRVVHPDARILVLSASDARVQVLSAVRAGAAGYLIKTAGPKEIIEAVLRIHGGELVFPPALSHVVLAALQGQSQVADEHLTLVLADDSVVRREGLARLLSESGFVVGASVSVGDAAATIAADHPDVAIVTFRADHSGVDDEVRSLRRIRDEHPESHLLVLAERMETSVAIELMGKGGGGFGYLLTERVPDIGALADAIRRVCVGEAVVDPELVRRLVGKPGERTPLAGLTDGERQVLSLMAEGRSNQAIAERLFLSPKTVEARVGAIFTKLGLETTPDDHRRILAVLTYLRSP